MIINDPSAVPHVNARPSVEAGPVLYPEDRVVIIGEKSQFGGKVDITLTHYMNHDLGQPFEIQQLQLKMKQRRVNPVPVIPDGLHFALEPTSFPSLFDYVMSGKALAAASLPDQAASDLESLLRIMAKGPLVLSDRIKESGFYPGRTENGTNVPLPKSKYLVGTFDYVKDAILPSLLQSSGKKCEYDEEAALKALGKTFVLRPGYEIILSEDFIDKLTLPPGFVNAPLTLTFDRRSDVRDRMIVGFFQPYESMENQVLISWRHAGEQK